MRRAPLLAEARLASDRGEPMVFLAASNGDWLRPYVYVDNIGVVGTSQSRVEEALREAEQVFEEHGLKFHVTPVGSQRAEALGVELDGESLCIRVKPGRAHVSLFDPCLIAEAVHESESAGVGSRTLHVRGSGESSHSGVQRFAGILLGLLAPRSASRRWVGMLRPRVKRAGVDQPGWEAIRGVCTDSPGTNFSEFLNSTEIQMPEILCCVGTGVFRISLFK